MANFPLFANVAGTTLAGSITAADTSVSLAAGTGALFPSPGAGQYFLMTFNGAANPLLREIVQVTARSGDVCTIVRAQEDTSALPWTAGDLAANKLTAGTMTTILDLFAGPYVNMGTGIGQTPNVVDIGWSAVSKLKLTIDATDEGNIALETWVSSNFLSTATGGTVGGPVTVDGTFINNGSTTVNGGVSVSSNVGVGGGISANGTINSATLLESNDGVNTAGNLLVGSSFSNTNPSGTAQSGAVAGVNGAINTFGQPHQFGNAGGPFVVFTLNTAVVGSISNGGSGGVSYNATSDYRIKENVVPLTGALSRISAAPVHRFNFVGYTATVDGFLAHELAEAVPESVTGTKDATATYANAVISAAGGTILASGVSEADWTAGKLPIATVAAVAAVAATPEIPATATTPAIPAVAAIAAVAGVHGRPALYPADSTWQATITVPVYQQVDQSKLTPVMWGGLQEASALISGQAAQIAALTAQVAALVAQVTALASKG